MQHDMAKSDAVIEGMSRHAHRTAEIKLDARPRQTQAIARCNDFGKHHGSCFKCLNLVFTIGPLGAILNDENA